METTLLLKVLLGLKKAETETEGRKELVGETQMMDVCAPVYALQVTIASQRTTHNQSWSNNNIQTFE
jgi:hypothetical protein